MEDRIARGTELINYPSLHVTPLPTHPQIRSWSERPRSQFGTGISSAKRYGHILSSSFQGSEWEQKKNPPSQKITVDVILICLSL